jgi:DNA repair exonuclease SbcCD ATPase subunit
MGNSKVVEKIQDLRKEDLKKVIDEVKKEIVEDVQEIKKEIVEDVKAIKKEIVDVLEKEAEEREYRLDQPLVRGVVIHPGELRKLQDDNRNLKKQLEDVEKLKVGLSSAMEGNIKLKKQLEEVEKTKAEMRNEMQKKIKTENQVKDLKKSQTDLMNNTEAMERRHRAMVAGVNAELQEVLGREEALEENKRRDRQQLTKLRQELEAAARAVEDKAGEIEELNRRLSEAEEIMKQRLAENNELKDINSKLNIKKEKMKALLIKNLTKIQTNKGKEVEMKAVIQANEENKEKMETTIEWYKEKLTMLKCAICKQSNADAQFMRCQTGAHIFCFPCFSNWIDTHEDWIKKNVAAQQEVFCPSGERCLDYEGSEEESDFGDSEEGVEEEE